MVKEVTRSVKREIERELYARAAGRCQFNGHNILLMRSPVTQESVNAGQKAHIWSFSEDGPRGRGPHTKDPSRINDAENLILMCYGCHKLIDAHKDGGRYTAELLQEWKRLHEQRIERVTAIGANRHSHLIIYGADIGNEKTNIDADDCVAAMFKESWYPAAQYPISITLDSERKDDDPSFWSHQDQHLQDKFRRKVSHVLEEDKCPRFSVFGLAPQPLLIRLGTLLTDKTDSQLYQLHREPKGWSWSEEKHEFDVRLDRPENIGGRPVLALSISAAITRERIENCLPGELSVWHIRVSEPFNDILQSQSQLARFSEVVRKALVDISKAHTNTAELSIFPAMPVACSVMLGMARQPKADNPWVIFDQNNKKGGFIETIRIGDVND